MSDDTDELANPAGGSSSGPSSLSWPLVERRRRAHTPPGGLDRRVDVRQAPVVSPTLSAAPLWPFRLAALIGAGLRAYDDLQWSDWPLISLGALVLIYNLGACVRPVPYNSLPRQRWRIAFELVLHTVAVAATGAWASPLAVMFVPTMMLAGFAVGGVFSVQLAAAAVVVVTAQQARAEGLVEGLQSGGVWAALLGLMAYTSGLAHSASVDAARQGRLASDRVTMLAEANSLLFALQRVTRTLPASLDLDDVLDSTIRRVRTMIDHDAVVVYMINNADDTMTPIRAHGVESAVAYSLDHLPLSFRTALEAPKTVRIDSLAPSTSVSPDGRSGLYAALRARGELVGLLAVESNRELAFGQQQAEIVHGLAEPFGIAIDNARMFRQIHAIAADEERSRIARDLHDHIGSSLALIGFEIDRASSVSAHDEVLAPVLLELRLQVNAAIGDVRETLHDLRTEVTDDIDLAGTLTEHLRRVEQRSGIRTAVEAQIDGRLPLVQERELWQIMREAITNVERHAHAGRLLVGLSETADTARISVRDDGAGFDVSGIRPENYGIIGMRERAQRIGAEFTIRTPAKGGTEVRVELPTREHGERT